VPFTRHILLPVNRLQVANKIPLNTRILYPYKSPQHFPTTLPKAEKNLRLYLHCAMQNKSGHIPRTHHLQKPASNPLSTLFQLPPYVLASQTRTTTLHTGDLSHISIHSFIRSIHPRRGERTEIGFDSASPSTLEYSRICIHTWSPPHAEPSEERGRTMSSNVSDLPLNKF